MTEKLSKALVTQRKKSEPFRKTLYGSLGIPLNGQKLVQVPNRQSYVYVRLNDNQNEVIQAFNNTVAPSYDLPVIVMREGGRYTVKQVNTQRYENNWNNSSPYLPAHGTAHSFYPGGGADISWIYSRQIMHGLVYPNATGTTVDIASFPLYTPNGWVLAGATGTVNLLQYRPVSGSAALMALLYADSSNGNPGLLVNSGSYFAYDITGSIYSYIPRPNLATQIPLAAIRLSTGTLSVGWDNLYDVRQWIHSIPSGTSSGGGGSVDTLGFAGLYNGIPLGTGTSMNVRGNATFSRSGSMFDLNVHNPGVDQIGIYGLNKGVPVGTGSWFNVNGSRLILTISGTVLNLSNSPDPFDNIGMYGISSGTNLGTGTILSFNDGTYGAITGTTIFVGSYAKAETNANNIFRVDTPGGVSAFAGTIATLPGGAVLTYNVSSGQEGAMVPTSTSQLGKMRLYNTTRGTSALILNCVVGTNTITLTSTVPVGWATTDVITIASQTVSGDGRSWVDIEITSGPTHKRYMFMRTTFLSATVGDDMRIHPFDASFSTSKYFTPSKTVVTNQQAWAFGIQSIVSNLFSLAWSGTPTAVVVDENGYLQ